MTGLTTSRVAPFGHLGINACVPLPPAYRSLPRPSSPPCAQASPTCLRSLDYNNLWFKQSGTILFLVRCSDFSSDNHLHPAATSIKKTTDVPRTKDKVSQ